MRHELISRNTERIGDSAIDICEQAALVTTTERCELSDASHPDRSRLATEPPDSPHEPDPSTAGHQASRRSCHPGLLGGSAADAIPVRADSECRNVPQAPGSCACPWQRSDGNPPLGPVVRLPRAGARMWPHLEGLAPGPAALPLGRGGVVPFGRAHPPFPRFFVAEVLAKLYNKVCVTSLNMN
jgi:hypothetical protein